MVALLLVLAAAAQEPAPRSPNVAAATGSERRLSANSSREAWDLVQKRLQELGFTWEKTDPRNQALLTKWRGVRDEGLEWLPSPRLPEPYLPSRIRFVVFVSPFAEPARVYVGSVFEAKKYGLKQRGRMVEAWVYNARIFNRGLMGKLADVLGPESPPGDDADDCAPRAPDANFTAPRKIPLSEFELMYPASAVQERVQGTVRLEFTIQRDGGVTDVHLVGSPLGHQLESQALAVASLLLYAPGRLGDCLVPTKMTYDVRYNLQ